MIHTETQAKDFVRERCSADAFGKLEQFVEALVTENKRQNLVSCGTLNVVWKRHIADSAQLLDYVPRETSFQKAALLDLGSGAGLPGFVIAIMRPDWPVVLVESRRQRVEWLRHMMSKLGRKNCRVEGRRLELVDSFEAGVISARAFAPLKKLLDMAARFSTDQTMWLLPKGRSARQELAELPKQYHAMFHVEQSRTDAEAGILVGHLRSKAKRKP